MPLLLAMALLMQALSAWAMKGWSDELFSDRFEDAGKPVGCTIENWSSAVGLAPADAGTQDEPNGFRRYGGPCGLRVAVDGSPRYLIDYTPMSEGSYNARFYAFLDDAGTAPVDLMETLGSFDTFRVVFNWPSTNDLTLRIFDYTGAATNLTATGLGTGWHSIEVIWESDQLASIALLVDGVKIHSDSVDTSGLAVVETRLGNINGANSGGFINFDDFDSRRISWPGRLDEGDANDDGVIDVADLIAVSDEISDLGLAPGQPDCDENGSIDEADIECLVTRIDTL